MTLLNRLQEPLDWVGEKSNFKIVNNGMAVNKHLLVNI